MKFSLTLILYSLIFFITSCATVPDEKNYQLKLNLNPLTSAQNKEIILETLLKGNFQLSLSFENESSYLLQDDLFNSNLKYFCNSFLDDQRDILELALFKRSSNNTLIVYTEEFEESTSILKKKYPNELYLKIDKDTYEKDIIEILNIDLGNELFSEIKNMDKNIELKHSPRSRKDILKIYFISNYDIGKTIVPLFRSYSSDMDFYATSMIFHDANSIKKLIDFENTYIPFSENLIKNISKKDITYIKKEIQKSLISDFLTVEKIYQNNLFGQNIDLASGNSKIKKNNCIKRDLKLWEVSTVSY